MQVAAVAAAPGHDPVSLEHASFLEVLRQIAVALLVLLLRDGNALERESHILESFLARHFGEIRVQACPFVFFAGGGGLEVLKRRADYSCRKSRGDFDVPTLKKVEEPLGVLLFLRC